MALPYIYYELPYVEIGQHIKDPTWVNRQIMEYIADWVPGGRMYPTIFNKPENLYANPDKAKICQPFYNADRFEFALDYVFDNLIWQNKNKGFFPGVGDDTTDFVDEFGHGIDGKIYWDMTHLRQYTLDLFMNKEHLALPAWHKAVNKLFHTPGTLLLAYDNANRQLYAISRPAQVILPEDIDNYIHIVPEFIPNVVIKDGHFAIDDTRPFGLVQF